MDLFFGLFQSNRQKTAAKPFRRRLGVESLEVRELLSVSLSDLPQPEYSAPIAADLAVLAVAATPAQTKLAAPKKVSKDIDATLTTLTIRWAPPTTTVGITDYQVTLRDAKTKAIIATETVVQSAPLTCKFENLHPSTKYEILVTSIGDPGATDSSKATLTRSATTAKFSVPSIKADKPSLTSTNVVITNNDKVLPFVDGKTVKTYTIQYALKTTAINWTAAPSVVIPAGTTAANAAKGTVNWTINGLQPGTNYVFRVTATYVEGTQTMTSTSKDVSFKTAALPAPTLSKVAFTLVGGEFGLFATVKQPNSALFQTGSVTYSLYFSTSSAKATGLLPDSQPIGTDKIGTAATFNMQPVTLKAIADLLGDSSPGNPALLGLSSINLQVVATYTSGSVTAEIISKVLKVALPKWYVPT